MSHSGDFEKWVILNFDLSAEITSLFVAHLKLCFYDVNGFPVFVYFVINYTEREDYRNACAKALQEQNDTIITLIW